MDFENEKKQEETPKEGFQREQREFRPGRSPRPRIHNGQRPAYERPSYNNREEDEGGFRPEGFGAGLQSGTPQRPSYRPRTVAITSKVATTVSPVREVTNLVNPVKAVSSLVRVRVATMAIALLTVLRSAVVSSPVSLVRVVMASRVVISLVAISRVRAVTTPIILTNPTSHSRRMVVPIRPTMIRMPSIA